MVFDVFTVRDTKLVIGEFVRSIRKQRGLKQEELASELNISRITISNLEQGKNTTLDTLLKVFLYFDELEGFHAYFSRLISDQGQDSLY